MDSSRDIDLYQLQQRIGDETLSDDQRKRARRSFDGILRQRGDKVLAELRHRLILATRANDHDAVENISGQIQAHSRKMNYSR